MVKIPTWGGEDSKNLRAYIKKIYKIHPLTEFFHPPTESFLIRSNAGETAVHDLVGIEDAVKMVGLVLENNRGETANRLLYRVVSEIDPGNFP